MYLVKEEVNLSINVLQLIAVNITYKSIIISMIAMRIEHRYLNTIK